MNRTLDIMGNQFYIVENVYSELWLDCYWIVIGLYVFIHIMFSKP